MSIEKIWKKYPSLNKMSKQSLEKFADNRMSLSVKLVGNSITAVIIAPLSFLMLKIMLGNQVNFDNLLRPTEFDFMLTCGVVIFIFIAIMGVSMSLEKQAMFIYNNLSQEQNI